jgi:hypothetical protein
LDTSVNFIIILSISTIETTDRDYYGNRSKVWVELSPRQHDPTQVHRQGPKPTGDAAAGDAAAGAGKKVM